MATKTCNCNPPLPWWQRRDWTCWHGVVWHVERVTGRPDGGIAVATPTSNRSRRRGRR